MNNFLMNPDRAPLPFPLSVGLVVLAELATVILLLKAGVVIGGMAWLLGIAAITLMTAGWFWLESERAAQSANDDPAAIATGWGAVFTSKGMLLMAFGVIVAYANILLNHLSPVAYDVIFAVYACAILYDRYGRQSRIAGLIIAPLLWGMIFAGTAALFGHVATGIFPGVIAALLVVVVRVTLDIEHDVNSIFSSKPDHDFYDVFHNRLAWTAMAFFFFGVVSFWPWLGMLYGQTYFWILIVGVIFPLVFFWGRLRQPRQEGARVALLRFNRISPIVGVVLLIAFALS